MASRAWRMRSAIRSTALALNATGKQIVQRAPVDRADREMVGVPRRAERAQHRPQVPQVRRVQRARAAERHGQAVGDDRISLGQPPEDGGVLPAPPQVVLGRDLEEIEGRPLVPGGGRAIDELVEEVPAKPEADARRTTGQSQNLFGVARARARAAARLAARRGLARTLLAGPWRPARLVLAAAAAARRGGRRRRVGRRRRRCRRTRRRTRRTGRRGRRGRARSRLVRPATGGRARRLAGAPGGGGGRA